MKKLIYVLPVLLFILVFAGCKKNNIQLGNNVDGEFVACTAEEKAAENCNMIYSPVCGDDGETYGNVCVACSSQNIKTYRLGECDCTVEDGICSIEEEKDDIEDSLEQDDSLGVIIDVPVPNF